MFLIVYKQNSRDRTLAKQLHFHHRVVKVQTRKKSAVKWVVLVTFMFLLCYGIFLRCNVLFLTGHKCGSDFYYKVPLQVIKSGKQKCGKALIQKASFINNSVDQATQEILS